jgi:ribonuclease inhibitor
MRVVTLNGDNMTSREEAHIYLSCKLDFPEYYGRNLDALWDILSTISEPMEIRLLSSNKLKENLGEYAESLLSVFEDASEENENLSFELL